MLCKRDCLRAYLAGRRHDFDADLSRRRFPDQNEMTRYLRKEARSRGPKITGFDGTIYRKIMENLQEDLVLMGKSIGKSIGKCILSENLLI